MVTGQTPHDLEGDGWHAADIHEAVFTWCEMEGFLRGGSSTDCVQHRVFNPAIHRLPFRRGRRQHGGFETEPPLDAVPPVMGGEEVL